MLRVWNIMLRNFNEYEFLLLVILLWNLHARNFKMENLLEESPFIVGKFLLF